MGFELDGRGFSLLAYLRTMYQLLKFNGLLNGNQQTTGLEMGVTWVDAVNLFPENFFNTSLTSCKFSCTRDRILLVYTAVQLRAILGFVFNIFSELLPSNDN
jgi:hypothetical protein